MPVRIKPTSTILLNLGLNKDGAVEKFATETCAKHMDKYVPFDKGILAQYYIVGNEIHYDQPYASYQYYGQRQDGSHVIKNYSKEKHTYAGAYWDKRMMSAEGTEVIQEIQDYVRRK